MDDAWDDDIPNLAGELAPIDFRQGLRGGYADVYQSIWKEQLVAVKVFRPIGSLKSMKRKIKREGLIWSKLNHPNILSLIGFADDDEGFQPFGALISPWCYYGNSEEYLSQKASSLDLDSRVRLLCGATEGAIYLHSRDPPIVHGDIKPANILIDQDGIPKLCDFGLSRIFLLEGATGLSTTTAHTGTPRYLAPELVDADEPSLPTRESDVYAMGCLGLKFLFLKHPYEYQRSSVPSHIFRDILKGLPPARFPDELDKNLEQIAKILHSTWHRMPSNRPTMSGFLVMLKQVHTSIVEDERSAPEQGPINHLQGESNGQGQEIDSGWVIIQQI